MLIRIDLIWIVIVNIKRFSVSLHDVPCPAVWLFAASILTLCLMMRWLQLLAALSNALIQGICYMLFF